MSSRMSTSGPRAAEAIQQLQQRLEQPHLRRGVVALGARGAVVETGQQRGQLRPAARGQLGEHLVALAHERPQRAEQRPVGKLAVTGLHGLSTQDGARAGPRSQTRRSKLGQQPRLADPGLAGEQNEARPALSRLRKRELQLGQLGDPPDEVRAREPGVHE